MDTNPKLESSHASAPQYIQVFNTGFTVFIATNGSPDSWPSTRPCSDVLGNHRSTVSNHALRL